MFFIQRLLERGTQQFNDLESKRKSRFLNVALLIALVNCLIFAIKNLFLGHQSAATVEFFYFVMVLFTYWLHKTHYNIALILLIILMDSLFLLVSIFIFPGQGTEIFFIFMAGSTHVFFKNKFAILFFFCLNLGLYYIPQLVYKTYQGSFFNYLVPLSVFTAFFLLFRFFVLQNEAYETKLNKQNIRLKNDKSLIEKQAKDLQKLDEEKTTFFENISHEFRTPLTLISGITQEILATEDLQKYDNRVDQKLQLLHQNTTKLTAMVEEILRLAKLGRANYQLLLSPVIMQVFFGKMIDAFQFLIKEKNIEITLNISPQQLTLKIDEAKMDQIWTNLLSNAIKYSNEGGHIEINAEVINGMPLLSIENSGDLIPEDTLPYIFDRYIGSSEFENSNGIGLAVVKELVELHKGEIWIDQKPPSQSIFNIQLGEESLFENLTFSVHPGKEIPQKNGKEILLVDDNSDMLDYLTELLSDQGFRISRAANGQIAQKIIENSRPDLIITDYVMPLMNGKELITYLKSNVDLQHIPVLFLSAKSDQLAKEEILELGAEDYILKPFYKKELIARIDNLIKIRDQKIAFALTLKPEDQGSDKETFIRQFKELVEKNISDSKLTIPSLATELNITERSIYRKVKETTGLTPNDLIKEIRLQYARRLLENQTSKNLKQIAYTVGIETSGYFVKIFEERFGKHPGEYQSASSINSTSESV